MVVYVNYTSKKRFFESWLKLILQSWTFSQIKLSCVDEFLVCLIKYISYMTQKLKRKLIKIVEKLKYYFLLIDLTS